MLAATVLFLGDRDWPEFRAVHGWLAEHSAIESAANVDTAVELLQAATVDPLLIVVGESWPGQFTATAVDRLRRLAPLARVSHLLGAWSEGQSRTGKPLLGATACYWHQWLARNAAAVEALAGADRSAEPVTTSFALPPTATDEDRLLAQPPATRLHHRGLVTVHSTNREMAAALCDAAAARGLTTLYVRGQLPPHITGVTAAICDLPGSPTDAENLRRLSQRLAATQPRPAIIAALVSFPRMETRDQLRAAGASIVVSKPLWLDDLFGQLGRALEPL